MAPESSAMPATPRFRRIREAGTGLAEYALILALVAVLAIGASIALGAQVSGTLSNVGDQFGSGPAAVTSAPTAPPSSYKNRKTCVAANHTWIKKPKPAHCA